MEARRVQQRPDIARNLTTGSAAICGVLGVLEIVVAVTVVVGFFSALSQPMSWSAAAQVATCGALGALLWRADAKLSDQNAEC